MRGRLISGCLGLILLGADILHSGISISGLGVWFNGCCVHGEDPRMDGRVSRGGIGTVASRSILKLVDLIYAERNIMISACSGKHVTDTSSHI